MQNGTYVVRHKVLTNVEHHMIAYNGLLRMYTKDGKFIRSYTHDIIFETNWKVEKQLPPEPKLYNIEWLLDGKQKELIRMNASYAVCINKIKMMKPRYKIGLLKPLRVF